MSKSDNETPVPEIKNIPRHVAIIMDGNGRWAQERGRPRTEGHRAGADTVQACAEACGDLGIEFLTLYAFSSENWKRPKKEIGALMTLLERFLKSQTKRMIENNIRLQAIGSLSHLPERCQNVLHKSIAATSENSGLTLILALSYGGREEIIDGIKSVIRHVQEGHLDRGHARSGCLFQASLHALLSRPGSPDPDFRGNACVQLSSLADQLCRDCHFGQVLARLHQDGFLRGCRRNTLEDSGGLAVFRSRAQHLS